MIQSPVQQTDQQGGVDQLTPGTNQGGDKRTDRGEALRSLVIPVLAVVTALIIAGVIIVATDPNVIEAFTHIERFVVARDGQISLSEASDIFSRARLQAGDVISLGDERIVVVERVTQDLGQLTFDGAQALSLEEVRGRQVQVGDSIALPGLWEVMVVETVTSFRTQVSVETARKYVPNAQDGDVMLASTRDDRRTVVEAVTDEGAQISLGEARALYPTVGPGVAIIRRSHTNPCQSFVRRSIITIQSCARSRTT